MSRFVKNILMGWKEAAALYWQWGGEIIKDALMNSWHLSVNNSCHSFTPRVLYLLMFGFDACKYKYTPTQDISKQKEGAPLGSYNHVRKFTHNMTVLCVISTHGHLGSGIIPGTSSHCVAFTRGRSWALGHDQKNKSADSIEWNEFPPAGFRLRERVFQACPSGRGPQGRPLLAGLGTLWASPGGSCVWASLFRARPGSAVGRWQ